MNYDNLDQLLDHIWNYVQCALVAEGNAMTLPTFVTTGPSARTIALRKASRDERALLFHTDARSQKIVQLEASPRAVWLCFDEETDEQFHLIGDTTVHRDDSLADELWTSAPDDEQAFYFKPSAPGSPTDQPRSGVRRDEVDETTARQNFAAIRTVVDEIRWLYVGHDFDDERQARFAWDGNRFKGEWLVP